MEKENGQRQQQQQQHHSASLGSHMFNGFPTHTRSLQNSVAGNIPPGRVFVFNPGHLCLIIDCSCVDLLVVRKLFLSHAL